MRVCRRKYINIRDLFRVINFMEKVNYSLRINFLIRDILSNNFIFNLDIINSMVMEIYKNKIQSMKVGSKMISMKVQAN